MSSLIANYLEFCKGNEVPQSFHRWCGMYVISSLLSKKVWISMGTFKIYPNLYTILVGPPGSGKSTGLKIAQGILQSINASSLTEQEDQYNEKMAQIVNDNKGKTVKDLLFKPKYPVPMSADCQTKESLTREMVNYTRTVQDPATLMDFSYTPLSICATEMSQFMSVDPSRMMDFLVTVFDIDDYEVKTKGAGSEFLPNVFVNLLGCTTPMWIQKWLREDIIGGGFSRRCIFVCEEDDTENVVPFPVVTIEMAQARNRFVDRVPTLISLTGEFKWDPAAKLWYDKWYREGRAALNKQPEFLRAYYRTRHVLVLRVAMILAVSRTLTLKIFIEDLEAADASLIMVEENLEQLFGALGRNETAAYADKIVRYVMAQPYVSEKNLKIVFYKDMPAKELFDTLNYLKHEAGLLTLAALKSGERVLFHTSKIEEMKAKGILK